MDAVNRQVTLGNLIVHAGWFKIDIANQNGAVQKFETKVRMPWYPLSKCFQGIAKRHRNFLLH